MKPYPIPTLLCTLLLAACQPSPAPAPAAPAASDTAAASAAPDTSGFYGTDIRRDDIGGDFTLTGGDGKPFSLSSLKGKVVLLTFGYTNCPDVCPTSLVTYNDVLRQLGGRAEDVAVVMVSVDPERDTPETTGRYAAQFNPGFIGLSSADAQNIAQVKQQYRVVSAKAAPTGDNLYLVDHTAGTFVINKAGETVLFEPYGKTATEIAADVKILLQ
ncbi:SCO family protein [Neisseria leonii]|uniref:SCO family protein n=1 Tax=Neisseria leonii TaxID=2995413 RepID=A0A9X4ID33_9NEIS|nr:SCO family protein [Neisseria sp. 51.81]MDD9327296.1 SCO family protein [Neisseria sp. 51.81]